MKHLLIAVVIGVITIGISIFVLSDPDDNYEKDAKEDRSITLGDSFEGENYTLVPTSFDCAEYESQTESDDTQYGCVLSVELTNTTIFEQILNLDGDQAVSMMGEEFESSDSLSRQYVADNGLVQTIDTEETVEGGVFFQVPEGETIREVRIFESANSDAIVIAL